MCILFWKVIKEQVCASIAYQHQKHFHFHPINSFIMDSLSNRSISFHVFRAGIDLFCKETTNLWAMVALLWSYHLLLKFTMLFTHYSMTFVGKVEELKKKFTHKTHELLLFYWSHKTWFLQWRVFKPFRLATHLKYIDMQPHTKSHLSFNFNWLSTQHFNTQYSVNWL